jgi:hypothetical protein
VGNWYGQFDIAHTLSPNTRNSYLDTATITNHTLVLDAFVFSTGTLIIANGTKYLLTKKTARLGLKCPIVYCFGVLDLASRP